MSVRPSGNVIGRRKMSPRASFLATSFADIAPANRYSPAFSSRSVPVRYVAIRNVSSSRTTPDSTRAWPIAREPVPGAISTN